MLGHSPGMQQRVARLVLCRARAAGSEAKNAQDMALQKAGSGGRKPVVTVLCWSMERKAIFRKG